MDSFLKPLKASAGKKGKSKVSDSTMYERVVDDEKPYLVDGPDHNPRLQQEDMALKRRIRFLKLISRFLAFLISVAVFGMMGNTAFSYYSTSEQKKGTDNLSAWPDNTKTWPTLMMLGVSLMSLVSNAVVMLSYCCGHSSANKTDSVSSFFSAADMVVHAICWGISAGLFKQQSALNGVKNDIWSWTCSTAADERQALYADVVNFEFLCKTNGLSWYIAVANTVSHILSFVIFVLAIKRLKSKQKANATRAAAAGGVHIPFGSYNH
ncbi:hypothetical protein P167DRAFT_578129 [Morchella conica CCBAS932]|uniref:MARVEL domain-containing protein n=1 Tax=Morchella conica CCBAS932 TaxID=1392247 RepID=A0A3N4KDH7_9PEZI|nr:hypothetical protein P167DRAFT_578129 [Morchella conica CCBAS932]